MIPEDFLFDAEHVEIEREGESLLITPIPDDNGWPEGYLEGISSHNVGEDFIRHPQGEHRDIIW